MKIHRLQVSHKLPIGIGEAWSFFSTPANLSRITPADMHFEILSGADEATYAGQIITYRLRPLFNIPMNWVTEITQCFEGEYFVDEQRFGPYRFWHHLHRFTPVEGGVLMEDDLYYALPFGPIGELMGALFLHRRIRDIFVYREKVLNELFSGSAGDPQPAPGT